MDYNNPITGMQSGSLREPRTYALLEQEALSAQRSPNSEANAIPSHASEKNDSTSKLSKKRHACLGWWREIASFTLALCCTSLILAILIFIYNKPLDKWPLTIQPNSLVAVFSTITKSALLYPVAECLGQLKWHHFERSRTLSQMEVFDQASRGPWGALKFIFQVKGWLHLASLGSLITVLMLGFEPFTQQVIQFSPRRAPIHNMTGYITKAHSFTTDSTISGGTQGKFALDTALHAVIARVPMIDSQSMSVSNKYCPGTDCKYPSFSTLASCWQCETKYYQTKSLNCNGAFRWKNGTITTFVGSELRNNMKFFLEAMPYQMEMSCSKTGKSFPTIPISMTVGFNKTSGGPLPRIVSIFLSSGEKSGFMGTSQIWMMTPSGQSYSMSFLQGCGLERSKKAALPRYSSWTCIRSWTDLSRYSSGDGEGAINLNTFGNLEVTISECSLDLCAKHYVNTTQAYEQSLQLQPDSNEDGLSLSIPKNATILTSDTYNKTAQPFTSPFQQPSPSFWDPVTLPMAERGPFTVESVAYTRLKQSFSALANLSDTLSEASYFNNSNGNFEPLFSDFSDVVTRYINSDWNTNRTNVTGLVYATTVYADVRFMWFVAPLLIILMSILFFTTTVLRDWDREYLFKTSLLPVLLHGLEGVAEETEGLRKEDLRKGDKEAYEALVRAAERIRVRLERNEEGVLKLKGE